MRDFLVFGGYFRLCYAGSDSAFRFLLLRFYRMNSCGEELKGLLLMYNLRYEIACCRTRSG